VIHVYQQTRWPIKKKMIQIKSLSQRDIGH